MFVTETLNIAITFINLAALLAGIFAVFFVFRLLIKNPSSHTKHYFYFLIFAVVAGFCDWIIFNWVILLVPGLEKNTTDLIYHIFWDTLGFPASLMSSLFLIKMSADIINYQISKNQYGILIIIIGLMTIISFTGLFLKLNGFKSIAGTISWYSYLYLIPLVNLFVMFFMLGKINKLKDELKEYVIFYLLLSVIFTIWYIFSAIPVSLGKWRNAGIFIYYAALFIPAYYFYFIEKRKSSGKSDKTYPDLDNFELTAREKEIVEMLIKGKSNNQIADELFISLQTVKNYVSRIYDKTGIKNRVELVNLIHSIVQNTGDENNQKED